MVKAICGGASVLNQITFKLFGARTALGDDLPCFQRHAAPRIEEWRRVGV
jgi:hypothetical protein